MGVGGCGRGSRRGAGRARRGVRRRARIGAGGRGKKIGKRGRVGGRCMLEDT